VTMVADDTAAYGVSGFPPPPKVGSPRDPTSQRWLGGPPWRTAVARLAEARSAREGGSRTIDAVVKVGGSLLADATQLDAVLDVLAAASRERRLLVVPGGGPFADAVREVDRQVRLPDAAAHWMAVLAMDQYGHVLVARLRGSVLVSQRVEIAQMTSPRSDGSISSSTTTTNLP